MDVSGVGSPFAATPDIGGGRCLAYCESLAISNGDNRRTMANAVSRSKPIPGSYDISNAYPYTAANAATFGRTHTSSDLVAAAEHGTVALT